MIEALNADQHQDGYWVNPEPRWLEGERTLATCYAVLSLEEALKGSGRLSGMEDDPGTPSSEEAQEHP